MQTYNCNQCNRAASREKDFFDVFVGSSESDFRLIVRTGRIDSDVEYFADRAGWTMAYIVNADSEGWFDKLFH
jgi:hypothetical protein